MTSPVPGPPAAVLSAILAGSSAQPGGRAVFSASNAPGLPSLQTEVVWLPEFAELQANVQVVGTLISQGWATGNVTAVSGAYTPLPTDAVILANAAGGALTVTLPDATQAGFFTGQRYSVIKTDSSANAVTVNASAGQLISGLTSVTLTNTGGYTAVVFDGANWWVWTGYTTTGTSPSGPAGGVLSGTYPNPGYAIPASLSGAQASNAILSVTNSTSAPTKAALVVAGASAGDRALALQVSGDTNARLRGGTDGKLQWGPGGSTTQDTDLYRSAANTLTTDGNLIVGGKATVNGSVFPGCCPPAVATAETFPRMLIGGATSSPTSGTLYVVAIMLPNGVAVNNITFVTKGTAAATVTHGWYVLLDSGLVVRAVTADQTAGSPWGTANTHYTFATNAYTTTYAGVYYLGVMVAATTTPLLATPATTPATTDIASVSPILAASSSTGQTTPPATGTTMGALTASSSFLMYAYTS